jgi:hypothetical protein
MGIFLPERFEMCSSIAVFNFQNHYAAAIIFCFSLRLLELLKEIGGHTVVSYLHLPILR